tara:strand:- start:1244 stop:1732 length:489 start_codon:yes stop_codon:yes gene_type:complete
MWTNTGKQRMFEEFFEASSVNNDFRLLLASATPPTGGDGTWNSSLSSTKDVGLASSLEVVYSGLVVPRSTTSISGFDVSSSVQLGASAARAVLVTAGDAYQYSGTITAARYVLLVEGESDGGAFTPLTPNGAEVYAWWDIGQPTTIGVGNTLTITGLSLQGN